MRGFNEFVTKRYTLVSGQLEYVSALVFSDTNCIIDTTKSSQSLHLELQLSSLESEFTRGAEAWNEGIEVLLSNEVRLGSIWNEGE